MNKSIVRAAVIFGLVLIAILWGYALSPRQESLPAEAKAAEQAPAQETPRTWQTVTTFSGSNNKRSDLFHLTGAKARLTYTITPQDQYGGGVSIYVMESHKTLDENGGTTEVSMAKTSGETMLYKSAGDYYFDISSYGADWTVTIEEYKS